MQIGRCGFISKRLAAASVLASMPAMLTEVELDQTAFTNLPSLASWSEIQENTHVIARGIRYSHIRFAVPVEISSN